MRVLAFLIATASMAAATEPGITFRRQPDLIDVLMGDELFTSFHTGDRWDKPFLYPLRTSGGIIISRAYPVDSDTGGSTDHIWQRGIWWAHGDINGTDFWRELGRAKTGRLVLRGEPKIGSNTLTAEMTCSHLRASPSALSDRATRFLPGTPNASSMQQFS